MLNINKHAVYKAVISYNFVHTECTGLGHLKWPKEKSQLLSLDSLAVLEDA